ncbi:transmembrane sensor/regulator PpyR [Pseudomonas sp. PDNC002]|uniref:transmembrane sensor/regulator PpyR n=1 Tax=Pseudomonas sp. PDNC002 TaxID=2811422 RepID=UPI0019628257|nr:transmembrane sensor/regulator PpyR [Pseudomonas sp. PDNC002]QRY78249.1 transmembrane sensor/regulator PpyR [Pseudomonas sp. PDNC002]
MSTVFENVQRLRRISSRLLVGGSLTLMAGGLLAYGGDAYLSMRELLAAHLMTILGPAAIKLGYVLRLQAGKSQRPSLPPALP